MQNYQFSFYTSPVASAKHKNNIVDLQHFASLVKDGTYKQEIEQIRKADEAERLSLKKRLHYATVAGIFQEGTRKEATLINHSGTLSIDIDEKENKHLDITIIKTNLESDPFILVAFLSPSGTGYKAIIQIDGNKHLESFLALESYFLTKYTIVIDKACKDVCRPCFVSYDPNLYCNENAKAFLVPDVSKQLTIDAPKTKEIHPATQDKKINDIELLCTEIESKKIDITSTYQTWVKIGFAIAQGLKESGRKYFHDISKFHHAYKFEETENQFSECLKDRKPGINYSSLFQVAKECGITVHSPTKNGTGNSNAVPPAVKPQNQKFWEIIEKHNSDGTKQFKGVEIDELSFLRLLYSMGYRRFDIGGGFSFIKLKNNIIQEVQPQQIQDTFFQYLKAMPEQIEKHVTREELTRLTIRKIERLFGKVLLSVLTSDYEILFNADNKHESFVYFKNGYVCCQAGEYIFRPYKDLQKAIWHERIIDRDFVRIKNSDKPLHISHGNYAKFIFNVAGQNADRFFSLCSLIGYLLHDYKEGKLKAVVLTDSKISSENEGRTGKTIFGKALKHIRNICELSGKDFKAEEKFKYQSAQLSTQIIFLNDAKRNFNLEALYNDITEGITIEKKNQTPVTLKVKYIITTNQIIKTQGASSRDRVIEFEFADHYSDHYSPEDEFKQWFFQDWSVEEWQLFDNFMLTCISLYIEQGLIEAKGVNLEKRKFIGLTSMQFFDFVEAGHLKPETEFSLQYLCSTFQELFPEYNFNTEYPTKRFSKWLKELPNYNEAFKNTSLNFLRKAASDHFYQFCRESAKSLNSISLSPVLNNNST